MFTVIEVTYKISPATGGSYFTVRDTGTGKRTHHSYDYGARSPHLSAALSHIEKVGINTDYKKIENAGFGSGAMGKRPSMYVIEH